MEVLTLHMTVQVAEDDMGVEAEAETQAEGEAKVKAGLQRAANKVRFSSCLKPITPYSFSPRTATQCSWR